MKPNRDLEYPLKVQDYYAQHRVLPSFFGIANLIELKATSAVSSIVGLLM